MEAIANQIASTVDTVDQGLVKVATFLSNLVKELGDLIGSVNLPELREKVQNEFKQLSSKVEGLLSQVKVIPDTINDLVTDLGTKVKQIDLEALKERSPSFSEKLPRFSMTPKFNIFAPQHNRESKRLPRTCPTLVSNPYLSGC
ncbi:MAG UNVERIFIED_CONTAM: hypothetical protein LVR29_06265 [Microcystis novacekii LVE1205-3]|jgi:hypothetical protein